MQEGRLRLAELYDGVRDGNGYFATDRFGLIDEAERQRVAQALDGGTVVIQALSPGPDVLALPGSEGTVEIGYRTDGVFVWHLAMAHYVRTYGLLPDNAFYAHMQSREFQLSAPHLTDELEESVLRLLESPHKYSH